MTDSTGRLLWISPALPGRTHDPAVARIHRIVRICERHGVNVLADRVHRSRPLGDHTSQTPARKNPPRPSTR